MTLERRSPDDDSPWEVVTDTYWARDYVQCRHCAGYSYLSDGLDRRWAKSHRGLLRTVARTVHSLAEAGRFLKFAGQHFTCSVIWLQGEGYA